MSTETNPINVEPPKIWFLFAIALVFGGVLASSVWILTPYSYWLDELFSVTAANESLSSLRTLLLGDVHPPLYQVLLKLWILIFGDSELSTRALSLGFATAAAVYLYSKISKYGNVFCVLALLFFTTNWLYAFYANETRAYSMMLFFATLLATNLPSENERPSLVFYASSILLSLTHYFGLLITGVTLALYVLRYLKHPRFLFPVLATGILCLAWPIYHMLVGELLNKTDGKFWIKVNGVLDSLRIAATGYMPKTGKVGGIILFAGLLFAVVVTRRNKKTLNISNLAFLNHVHTTAIISLVFLVLVAAIDLWSPLSTTRNYIVLLPFLSVSLAGTIVLLLHKYPKTKKIFLGLTIVYCSLALLASFKATYSKSMATQDWRGASLFIVNNHDGRDIYYITNSETNIWRSLVANFYLKQFSNEELQAQPYVVGETKLEAPAMILFGHNHSQADAIEKEMNVLGATQNYTRETPIDIRRGSAGVYVTD